MGSIKKALRPITRVVDNIIPNEIKPALPYLAATFGAPYLAGSSLFAGKGILSALGQGALSRGVSASLINAATNAALGNKFNPASVAASGLMAGGGFKLGESFPDSELAQSTAKFLSPGAAGDMTLTQAATAATAPLTAGTMQAAYDEAEKANREYDEYVRRQEEAGAADIQTRIDYITRYMTMAGFDQDQIDDALRRGGYRIGGRVGFSSGGSGTLGDSMQSIKILLMKNEIIEAGGGGFGGKDLDDKTDAEIIEIYEGMFGESKANGGRIGFSFGGTDPRGGKPTGDPILDSLIEESIDEETPSKGIMAATDFSPLKIFQKSNTGRVRQLFQQIEDGVNVSESMAELFNVYGIDLYGKNAKGGRIRYSEGGGDFDFRQMLNEMFDSIRKAQATQAGVLRDEEEKEKEIEEVIRQLDLFREEKAEGGIMNLKMGGMPAEMDLRGGGFVPIGAKEKADDVPARLSKNEFVMTADAVRAAGGGSVNKGAKRMYDLMNKLEARV
jgi:hypothetical protein